MRLLTEEERRRAYNGNVVIGYPPRKLTIRTILGIERVAKAQRDLTRKETLKAVGEWIEKHRRNSRNVYGEDFTHYWWDIQMSEVESLLRGEMPEEAQVKSEMGFTEEELKDLRHNAPDDTIG